MSSKFIKRLVNCFSIKREERVGAFVIISLFSILHIIQLCRHWDVFRKISDNYFSLFVDEFHLSGYDPLTYIVISHWGLSYNIYRHPMLTDFMYLPSCLNQWIIRLTGVNCASVIAAIIMLICVTYSFIFLFRIFRQILGLKLSDAYMLSVLHFSFGYTLVSSLAPDHFAMSSFMLIFALYISGRLIQKGKKLSILNTIILFVFTAGTTLSNGVKIFIDSLFVNKWRFFKPAYLIIAVIIPSLLMWEYASWQYRTYEKPKEKQREIVKKKKAATARDKAYQAFCDTTKLTDNKAILDAFRKEYSRQQRIEAKKRWESLHRGEAIKGKSVFLRWTDITTDRWDSMVENMMGESIMIHPDYLLGDTLSGRPLIVSYRWWGCYVVLGVFTLLFIIGIIYGWKQKFLWMVLSGFAFDMILHMGLGFGLNEVYIMSPHWLFIFPIAIGYAIKQSNRLKPFIRCITLCCAILFLVWNLCLLTGYLYT